MYWVQRVLRTIFFLSIVVLVGASSAAARPHASMTTLAKLTPAGSAHLVITEADPNAVLAYWTTQRIAAAVAPTSDISTAGGAAAPPPPVVAAGTIGVAANPVVVPPTKAAPAPVKAAPVKTGSKRQGTHCTNPAPGRLVCTTRDAHDRKLKQCTTTKKSRICTTYSAKTGKSLRKCVTRNGKTACSKTRHLTSAASLGTWGFTNQPIAAVGRIYFKEPQYAPPNDYLCSGTLITPDTVVTAAHCVISKTIPSGSQGYVHANLMFAPGQTGTQQADGTWAPNFPYGEYPVDRVDYFSEYLPTPDSLTDVPLDYALMHLSTPVANVTPFALRWDSPAAIGQQVYRYGYPGQGYYATAAGGDANFQVYCQTTVDAYWQDTTGYWMNLECPANGGSSGGPVFRQDSDGWFVVSVMSRCARDASLYCQTNSTPYLDSRFGTLWSHYLGGGGLAVPTVLS